MSVQVAVADASDLHYQRAFERHWDEVFRFSLAWTNDWAAAEDLTQDAYLRLWQQRLTLDWGRPVLPWLLVATRRLATDRFRSLRQRVLLRAAEPSLNESVHARWLDVRAAMETLSPLERTALLLTAVEGRSYGEVAEALGTSAGALRAAVSRAREKLEVA
jgi:RNA polymerase sigma-70 factor (ECF subfamily)